MEMTKEEEAKLLKDTLEWGESNKEQINYMAMTYDNFRKLIIDQIEKKFNNGKKLPDVSDFYGLVKATGQSIAKATYDKSTFDDLVNLSVNILAENMYDPASPFHMNKIEDHFAPELLAQLSFNDPEFIKALPDWVFGNKYEYYPLVHPYNEPDNLVTEDPVTISFKESYLSRLEEKFQKEALKVANDYGAFDQLCKDTKDMLGVVNERFMDAEKKLGQNEQSKNEVLDMFISVKTGTTKSTEKNLD